MLKKIERLKFVTEKGEAVVILFSSGLAKAIHGDMDLKYLIGGSVYGVIRALFLMNIKFVYIIKKGEWVKVKKDLLLKLANEPMGQ